MTEAERIRAALAFVPPDDRKTWLRMGMAVKAELNGEGFDLWDTWSQGADNYKASDARAVWRGIKPAGGVSIGTLFHEARANGWRCDSQRPTTAEQAERKRLAADREAKEQAETQRQHAEAAGKAAEVWSAATQAQPDHPYLVRKQVPPVATLREIDASAAGSILGYPPKSGGERITGRLLVVPVKRGGNLSTIELIDGDKRKAALWRGAKAGAYWATGRIQEGCGMILLGEGMATVLSSCVAAGHPGVAALSCGNLKPVALELRERHPRAVLVILADLAKGTGEPDHHAIEAARAVGGLLAVPEFGPEREPGMTDFNDLAVTRGAEAVRRAIANASRPVGGEQQPGDESAPPEASGWPEPPGLAKDAGLLTHDMEGKPRPPTAETGAQDAGAGPRYKLLGSDALRALPPLAWRVRGVLPASGVAALYGPSASGKSFLAMDVAAAIAEGCEWFGCRVMPAPVVYVCLEGEAGFRLRVAAWETSNGRPLPDDLGVVLQSFHLADPRDVLDLAAVVPAGGVLFLDTLNRAAPLADENSSRDMGQILEAAKALQGAMGGLVVLVHHTGKDSAKGLRGHSSLLAAMDAAVEVSRNDDRREWRVAKSKDGADGLAHPFKLAVVELGTDDHGDPVTSCVVEADQTASDVARVKLPQGGNQKLVMDALRTILSQQSPLSSEFPACVPPGRVAVELEAVLPEVAASMPCEPRRKTTRAREAVTALIARGVYEFREGWLWRA